jgi:hypothetical protein
MRVTVDDLEDEALLLVLDDGWLECGYNCLLVSRAKSYQERRRTSSKTFLSPRCVSAEHSTYLTAPSSLANRSPWSVVIGLCFCRASFSR